MTDGLLGETDPGFESLKVIKAFIRREKVSVGRADVTGDAVPEHLESFCGGHFLRKRWEEMTKRRRALQFEQESLLAKGGFASCSAPTGNPTTPTHFPPRTGSPPFAQARTASPPRPSPRPGGNIFHTPTPVSITLEEMNTPRGSHPSGYDPAHISILSQAASRHWGNSYRIPEVLTPVSGKR
eukprot:TRINITY_DN30386_c0_g1_i1.p1 TRINITY_DN30386_c0_g1~~TRINITY_DN30386_c0_g1_i1.p1  ORF type:complete len:195 (+),score=24.05 TRINITY_DN30386_c0_g1_i1:39-587(+)